MTREESRVAKRFLHGLNISVTGNAQAFGYSITITAVYGAVAASQGTPSGFEILGFALLGVGGFSALNLVVALLLRNSPPPTEKSRVLLLATATDFLAVGVAVGSAIVIGSLGHSWFVWLVAPLVASVLYVLVQAIEISVGRAQDSDDNTEDQ